jgi:pyruvate/2-oxoglutarate/acetoin dehydrogenase E1 component
MSTPTKVAVGSESEVVELSYREAVRLALEHELEGDSSVLLMGEDVGGAGGVYKTSDGLQQRFGADRIRDTPICENGFVGVAIGMAVTGLRPVVEIMFSDFLPTAGDAVVNELPKFRFMSGGQCHVPVTLRAVGGATGRFGTQHSATGESWFMSLPGLKVATVGTPASAYGVLRAAIQHDDPVLVFEHRALYGRKGQVPIGDAAVPRVGDAFVCREGSDITILSTLMMVERAIEAADVVSAEGISAEVIELRWLRPLDYSRIIESVQKTRRLLIVEEQTHAGGWGATIISELTLRGVQIDRVAAISIPDDVLIPYTPTLEDAVIPSALGIAVRIRHCLEDA